MYRGVLSSGLGSHWRREVLRTSLWFVPALEVGAAIVLFAGTLAVDRAAYHGDFTLPGWVISGSADAARQILTTIAAAIITVVGVVFSIILVTLTLASTQFGPRMLRNFIRDRGTQLTLGTFVSTFVYAVLVLASIGVGSHGEFVPHVGVTVTLGLMVADLAVRGHRFATVWPSEAAPPIRQALGRAHVVGPHRTLSQDVSFGIDQLVEIGLRALSAAVNDTFTALTCIDWLGENLCKIVVQWHPARVHRDDRGFIRVIAPEPSYDRLVQRAFEKLRQSSLGQPAVMIRLLDALARIMAETTSEGQRRVLLEQAEMINRACERSVPEAGDRADIQRRYEVVLTVESRLTATGRNT